MPVFRNIPDFGKSKSANWIFFWFLRYLFIALKKSEVIFPFSGIEQVQWWHVQSLFSIL